MNAEQVKQQMQERITRHAARLQLPEHEVAAWFLEGAERQHREASENFLASDKLLTAAKALA
jgi:hypothetical protein